MNTKSEKLRDACELASQTFRKIDKSNFEEIISKLDFCIGSFNFDRNPAGLFEYGYKALGMLKEIKKKNPKKISKAVITSLEESLA